MLRRVAVFEPLSTDPRADGQTIAHCRSGAIASPPSLTGRCSPSSVFTVGAKITQEKRHHNEKVLLVLLGCRNRDVLDGAG